MNPIKVSVIVSTYNAEKFFSSRVENLLNQTIIDRVEILVVDSGSLQNEGAVLQEFLEKGHRIKYVRTEHETLYSAWNRAIDSASGEYLTNANTDDRLLDDALEKLSLALDRQPEKSLAYSDYWETKDERDIVDCARLQYKPGRRRVYQPEYSHNKLLLHCYCGPFPMWRRSLHDQFGYFDPEFVVSGDWDYWLRLAEHTKFVHVAEPLGLVLRRDDSIVWRNQEKMLAENNMLRQKYFGQPNQKKE